MTNISYQKVKPDDTIFIDLIADWYLSEWNIPAEATIQRLSNYETEGVPFQIVMTIENAPIGTGGLYSHVGLLDHEPKFKIYGPWLALVYVTHENRNKGYGALLCEEIQAIAKDLDTKAMFLFTDTAEALYKRLGWQQLERVNLQDRDIVVMKKEV